VSCVFGLRELVSFVLKAFVIVAALGVAACGTSAFVAPAGPGEPALDAGPAWAEATKACRDVRTYSATLRLSGRSAGQGFPTLSAIVALTSRGQIFLQVVGAGRPFLTLAGTAERAVYLLHDDNRVVTARADEIVETIVGVKVSPDRLLAVLAGCAVRGFDVEKAMRFGQRLAVTTAEGTVFLERRAGAWQTTAAILDALTVHRYERERSAFPTALQIDAVAGSETSSIRVRTIEQLEINADLQAAVFDPPAGAAAAAPMTLEELRAAGPFGRK